MADELNPKVEYEVIEANEIAPDDLQRSLETMGRLGWQLVVTRPYFIFQRLLTAKELKAPVGFLPSPDE